MHCRQWWQTVYSTSGILSLNTLTYHGAPEQCVIAALLSLFFLPGPRYPASKQQAKGNLCVWACESCAIQSRSTQFYPGIHKEATFNVTPLFGVLGAESDSCSRWETWNQLSNQEAADVSQCIVYNLVSWLNFHSVCKAWNSIRCNAPKMQQSANMDRKSLHKSITRGHLKPGVPMSQSIIHLIIDFSPSCRFRRFHSGLVYGVVVATLASYQFSLRQFRLQERKRVNGAHGGSWKQVQKRQFFAWISCHIPQPTPVLNFI